MTKRFARVVALAATAAVTSAVATAGPAGAVEPGIQRPTLTVACGQPHHGLFYSAVHFRQHGRWGAGGSVVVTLSPMKSERPKATMHTKTRADGTFRLHRMLHSSNTGPWIAGASYTWTTAIYCNSSATARRGTVTLTNNC
jgi:hypothetical protein